MGIGNSQESQVLSNSPSKKGWQPQADGVVSTPRNTKKYLSLPYNPKLKEIAKKLRKSGNLSEVLIWNHLKSKKLLGLDFDRQKIIGNYIVDFYNPNFNVVIEIDGESHDFKGLHDQNREFYLKSLGLEIIHFNDLDIKQNTNTVIESLYAYFKLKLRKLPRQALPATPSEKGNS